MTYKESNDLMNDFEFRGRIKVAALEIATYYLSEEPTTPGHNSRYKWGQNTFLSPDAAATQLQPGVIMDAGVQSAGKDITDAALKTSVEAVVGKIL